MTIARHTLALLSIVGCSVDVLGSLYLAYDLLGGEHGPLRTLTRAVTYGALFGIGFGVFLGPVFALVTGITQGITLGWEFSRASRGKLKSGFWYDAAMSVIRGIGFGLGAAYLYGPKFGITFGALTAVGQTIAYQFGMRPTIGYEPSLRLRVTKFQVLGVMNRTLGYAVSGYLSALFAGESDIALIAGLRLGLVIGVLTLLVGACIPVIEWFADHAPQKRLGVFGVVLILIGFGLQSLQYWAALLEVPIR